MLSAPNHKSQIASDLKSRSPNRKNFPQIGGQNLYTNAAWRGPQQPPWRLFGVYAFASFFPLKTSFLVYTKPFFCLLRHLSFQSCKHLWCILFSLQSNRCLGKLKSQFQIARFVIWTSVQIAVRIAMPIPYTTSKNNEFFWGGSQCLKSLVICDSRFESQIAIAVKSRDLEHLVHMYVTNFFRGNEKISPKFFRPKLFHGRPRGRSVPKWLVFSRIWSAWPKFLAGCPQGYPAKNFPEFSFLILLFFTTTQRTLRY